MTQRARQIALGVIRQPTLAGLVVFAIAIGAMASSASSAYACSGALIEHIPIKQGGTTERLGTGQLLGYLDVYFNSGTGVNCARTNSADWNWGTQKWMMSYIAKCRQTSPSSVCSVIASDEDYGDFRYFAGDVTVTAPSNCIKAVGGIDMPGYVGYTSTKLTNGGREASHC